MIAIEPRIRTKICSQCKAIFSFEIKRGADKQVYCTKACQRAAKLARYAELRKVLKCRTPDCDGKVHRPRTKLCEGCYGRLKRYGDSAYRRKKRPERTMHSQGYVLLSMPGHPLAKKSGLVGEHRLVAYEHFGPGPQECFWCGKKVKWDGKSRSVDKLVIDHLNENKIDNRIENLVVACNPCNRARGSIVPFILSLNDKSLEAFIETVRAFHAVARHGESQ